VDVAPDLDPSGIHAHAAAGSRPQEISDIVQIGKAGRSHIRAKVMAGEQATRAAFHPSCHCSTDESFNSSYGHSLGASDQVDVEGVQNRRETREPWQVNGGIVGFEIQRNRTIIDGDALAIGDPGHVEDTIEIGEIIDLLTEATP
jgi:hypothetical protein